MVRTVLFILIFGITLSLSAQGVEKETKEMTAVRIKKPPVIDGKLNEEDWKTAIAADNFTQFQFKFNQPSKFNTEIKVLYDNTALYIGAFMHDSAPDSIMRELSTRDNLGSADFLSIIIDSYKDGTNATEFIVSASGVQLDAKMYPGADFGEDFSWDAVWVSAVTITNAGWVCEIKIPYSAIRFPNNENQTWGINFVREVKRNRDKSSWNTINPEIQGFVNQSGVLNGISNIKAPVRLSISPYLSAYYNTYSDTENDIHSSSTSFNGGADLKYGINDAFTLDMTLIPDFGQVQSDNEILNLTPFETKFEEQRQFFTEGTELFNKGGFFYSRRIGDTPIGFFNVYDSLDEGDEIISNPSQSKLINATKVSGRTTSGTGIGIFNAIEGETYATVKNASGDEHAILTGPRTNYNVLVIDQNLKNNSYITFVNTNVMREGGFYDANVSGTNFTVNDKENIFGFYGGGAVSQKYLTGFTNPALGYTAKFGVGKYGGKIQYGVGYNYEDANYDPNDLGFLYNNNSSDFGANLSYHLYKPLWHFNQLNINLNANYSRLVSPNKYSESDFYMETWASFRNFTFGGIFIDLQPITYDWFEARTPGRYYTTADNYNIGGWISTDYSKKFAYDANANLRLFNEPGRFRINVSIAPRYRINDKIALQASFASSNWPADEGFVTFSADSIIFGKRYFASYENVLAMTYTPNVKMGFSFRMRHYWSFADYKKFYALAENGSLLPTSYNSFDATGNSSDNVNFSAFNIDFVYTWYFAPGSQIDIVWKNSIFQFGSLLPENYAADLDQTFEAPQSNNFSIKVLYYLDYLYLKSHKESN